MDLSNMTTSELQQLIEQATNAFVAAKTAEANQKTALRAQIGEVIEQFTALLGPADAPTGVDSIRAVRAYDAADMAAGKPRGTTMAENSALALSLLYEGLEITASTVLKLAHLVKEDG